MCKRCWRGTAEWRGIGLCAARTLGAHSGSSRRDPQPTTATHRAGNGRVDAAGDAVGSFPAETTVVHVGDRGADLFPFFQACQATQTHFLVRAFENRRIDPEARPQRHLLDEVRSWPATASRPFQVPGSHGRTARSTGSSSPLGQ